MFTPEEEAYFEKITDKAAEKFFEKAMMFFEVDMNKPEHMAELRKDFNFMRTLRTGSNSIGIYTRNSMLGLAVAAAFGWMAKHWFGST